MAHSPFARKSIEQINCDRAATDAAAGHLGLLELVALGIIGAGIVE
jgi:hypothetical protein